MIINKETVEGIAHLARLELEGKETVKMVTEMNKILEWMNQLDQVDTEGVAPLIHMSLETNVLREDEVNNTLTHERALVNAPKKDSDYFRVPKVIE